MPELYPYKFEHDLHHILDGMLVLQCLFRRVFRTPIEYDMINHLRNIHQKDLVIRLNIGKGFSLDYRAEFAINIMKQAKANVSYDHNNAKFAAFVQEERDTPRRLYVVTFLALRTSIHVTLLALRTSIHVTLLAHACKLV
jgi:hypothetical protein